MRLFQAFSQALIVEVCTPVNASRKFAEGLSAVTSLVTTVLDGNMARFENALEAIGPEKAQILFSRVLNAEGKKLRTQVIRGIWKQTGLKRSTVVAAVKETKAGKAGLEYVLASKGGNIRLKFFRPKEFQYGTRAFPRNVATQYKGAFMKGGQFPNRVAFSNRLKDGGVYERVGKGKWPVRSARSGVYIPEEMVRGESRSAFNVTGASVQQQINRQLAAIFRGF